MGTPMIGIDVENNDYNGGGKKKKKNDYPVL